MNGWDSAVLTAAIAQCGANNGDPSGVIKSCPPLAASDIGDFAQKCPAQPAIVNEAVTGMLPQLPGCVTVTPGPADATGAQMSCGGNATAPSTNGSQATSTDSLPHLSMLRSLTLA